MSFGGPAASTSGWCTRPGERGIGSTGCAGRHQNSLLTGLYAMATAEHREPCDSRGSCTVLGAPGGETPSGDSSKPVDYSATATSAFATCRLTQCSEHRDQRELPFPCNHYCDRVRWSRASDQECDGRVH